MKNFANPRNIFSLALLITAGAFLAGNAYCHLGLPGIKNLKGPGNYAVELSPGYYMCIVIYSWRTAGLNNDNLEHYSFNIQNKSLKWRASFDSDSAEAKKNASAYQSLERTGYLTRVVKIKKRGTYDVSITSDSNQEYILSLIPTPEDFDHAFWMQMLLELEKARISEVKKR